MPRLMGSSAIGHRQQVPPPGGTNPHRELRVNTVLIETGAIAPGADRQRQMPPQGVKRRGNSGRTRCCNSVDRRLEHGQPVEDLPSGDAHALVAAPGDAPRTVAALVAA